VRPLANNLDPALQGLRTVVYADGRLRTCWSEVTVHVVLPLLAGGTIYVLWRPTTLHFFKWADLVGLNHLLLFLREVASVVCRPPTWVIFSAPAGLWLYSFLAALHLTWRGTSKFAMMGWSLFAMTLAVGSEAGQFFAVPGTFDVQDVAAYAIAAVAVVVGVGRSTQKSR